MKFKILLICLIAIFASCTNDFSLSPELGYSADSAISTNEIDLEIQGRKAASGIPNYYISTDNYNGLARDFAVWLAENTNKPVKIGICLNSVNTQYVSWNPLPGFDDNVIEIYDVLSTLGISAADLNQCNGLGNATIQIYNPEDDNCFIEIAYGTHSKVADDWYFGASWWIDQIPMNRYGIHWDCLL